MEWLVVDDDSIEFILGLDQADGVDDFLLVEAVGRGVDEEVTNVLLVDEDVD